MTLETFCVNYMWHVVPVSIPRYGAWIPRTQHYEKFSSSLSMDLLFYNVWITLKETFQTILFLFCAQLYILFGVGQFASLV